MCVCVRGGIREKERARTCPNKREHEEKKTPADGEHTGNAIF